MKKLLAMMLALCLMLSACPAMAFEIIPGFVPMDVALADEGTITAYIGTPLELKVFVAPVNADASVLKWTSSEKTYATVSDGLVTPKKAGTTVITVKTPDGKVKDTVKVKVVDPKKPTSVELNESGTVTLEMGSTLTLIGTVKPDTAEKNITWKTSDKKIAKVADGVVTPVGTGTATITVTATYGKTTKTDTVKVKVTDAYKPTRIELAESGTLSLSLDGTLTLHAAMTPAEAKSVPTWSSSDKKIATVDANGVVTPKKEGTVTITVKTYNGKKDTVKVKVFDPKKPSKVELDQTGTVLLCLDSTDSLSAKVYPDTAEYTMKWSSSNSKIASVDENGNITPHKEGTVTITAAAVRGKLKKTDTVKVCVYHPLKALIVTIDQEGTVKLDLGKTLDLGAKIFPDTAEYTLKWSSSDKKIAVVDPATGIVTPKKEGTVTITAKTGNGKTDTVKVKVVDPTKATSVALNYDEMQTITLFDDVLQLTATMQPATATSKITWSSSDKKIATVDSNGLVTPTGAGTATITVKTSTGKKDTLKVKVLDPYKPTQVVLNYEGTQTLTIFDDTLQLSAHMLPDIARSDYKWSSSSSKIAKVDSNGLVTPTGAGTATITVKTRNGKTDTVKVKVLDPYKPSRVVLTQGTSVNLDNDKTLTLETRLEPETARSGLTWSSSNKKIVKVDANGTLTPVKEGTATITVKTRNGKVDTIKVKVVDPYKPTKLKVSWMGSLNMQPGDTLQINTALEPATAVTTLTWKSSNTAVATVSSTGLVTCLKSGTAKITVTTANGISIPMTVKVMSERDAIVQSVKDALGSDLLARMKSAGYSITFQMHDAPSGRLWWQMWFKSKDGLFLYGNDKVNYTLMQDIYDAVIRAEAFGFTSADRNAFSNIRANLKKGGYNSQTANSGGWDAQLGDTPGSARIVQFSMDWYEKGGTNSQTIVIP